MTRGGSHERAAAIAEGVFGYPQPFPIPYEWVLVGGRKMASSKGVGIPAAEFAALLRPELARFTIVRPHYRQHVNFDPGGETIPQLYDEFDRAAGAFFGRESDPDLARTFYYAMPTGEVEDAFRLRFTRVAHLEQMPAVDLPVAAAQEKGGPLDERDRRELAARAADARRWLETYAPDSYRVEVQDGLPEAARGLSDEQRRFLSDLIPLVERAPGGDALHAAIHVLKGEQNLSPKAAFGAIYLAFLGKESGPQAGWFLAALDPPFVVRRLREAAGGGTR